MDMSLPVILPRDSHTLWYRRSSTFSFAPNPSSSSSVNGPSSSNSASSALHASQNQSPHVSHMNFLHTDPYGSGLAGTTLSRGSRHRPALSPLAQLAYDEAVLEQRKFNIRRFGATWIRPIGVAKTLQAELDERAEREDADAHHILDDMGEDGLFPLDELADTTAGDNERDLDDEIPEGDLDGGAANAREEEFEEGDLEDDDDDEVDLDAEIPEAEAETLWDEDDNEDDNDNEEEEDDDAVIRELYRGSRGGGGVLTRHSPALTHGSPALTHGSPALPSMASTFDGSHSSADESPQQALFSHDEAFGPERIRALNWRAPSRYPEPELYEDSMEFDSDG